MVVFLYVTGETMTGTKILKRVGVSLFQGTKKLKMAWLKESLRDYRKKGQSLRRYSVPQSKRHDLQLRLSRLLPRPEQYAGKNSAAGWPATARSAPDRRTNCTQMCSICQTGQ